MSALLEYFGNIDIYLFDQILRCRIVQGMKVLDAGCGSGRNLVYLLRSGYEAYGADLDAAAIAQTRQLAATLAPSLPATNFRIEPVERMSFPNEFADVVISSAVLHFARNDDQFQAMLEGTWRVLKPAGLLFCRLASSIGMEHRVVQIAGRLSRLPDGSERYLVDQEFLTAHAEALGGRMIDPLKTTIVQNQRSMTTWVLRKKDG